MPANQDVDRVGWTGKVSADQVEDRMEWDRDLADEVEDQMEWDRVLAAEVADLAEWQEKVLAGRVEVRMEWDRDSAVAAVDLAEWREKVLAGRKADRKLGQFQLSLNPMADRHGIGRTLVIMMKHRELRLIL